MDKILEIPVKEADQEEPAVIRITKIENLEDLSKVIAILERHRMDAKYYLELWNLAYRSLSRTHVTDAAEIMFKQVRKLKTNSEKESSIKAKLINTISCFYLSQASLEMDTTLKDHNMIRFSKSFSKASEEVFENAYSWRTKGFVNITLGKFDNAIKHFKNILGANPSDVISLYGLALIEFKNKDFDKAIELLKKIISINPLCCSDIYYLFGLSIYYKKEYKESAKIFELILK